MESRSTFDYGRFYRVLTAQVRGALHVRPSNRLDPFAVVRGELHVIDPLVFEWSLGGVPRDVVGTECPPVFLVSDRTVQTLRNKSITGWRTYPVTVRGKGGDEVRGYHGFSVTGRCGPIVSTLMYYAELGIIHERLQ